MLTSFANFCKTFLGSCVSVGLHGVQDETLYSSPCGDWAGRRIELHWHLGSFSFRVLGFFYLLDYDLPCQECDVLKIGNKLITFWLFAKTCGHLVSVVC